MSKKSKKAPKVQAAKAEPIQAPVATPEVTEVPKTPKPIGITAEGEVRAVKAGTKLAHLIDELSREEGTTLNLLAAELSSTGSKVDVAGVRSWLSYDLRRAGLGCRQDGDRLFLVGTPLPHREMPPFKKAPEATIQQVETEPKLKKAAGSSKPKRSKKAHAAEAR